MQLSPPQGKYLIYAEDDFDDILLFREYFSNLDHIELVIVHNGQEVLDFLSTTNPEQYPCLVVLDINMPKLNGWETAKALKRHADYREIPVIMFSTSAEEQEIGNRIGVDVDYLKKPFNPEEAQGVAKKLLRACEKND